MTECNVRLHLWFLERLNQVLLWIYVQRVQLQVLVLVQQVQVARLQAPALVQHQQVLRLVHRQVLLAHRVRQQVQVVRLALQQAHRQVRLALHPVLHRVHLVAPLQVHHQLLHQVRLLVRLVRLRQVLVLQQLLVVLLDRIQMVIILTQYICYEKYLADSICMQMLLKLYHINLVILLLCLLVTRTVGMYFVIMPHQLLYKIKIIV